MSTSEPDKAMVPPVETFVLNDRGMTAWRAVFDSIVVEKLPGGMRSIKVIRASVPVFDRILSSNEAGHLARLLRP